MIEFITSNPALIIGVLAAGFAAGFAGGLFGIGGGIITVPALYAVFTSIGIGEGESLKTAIGTSLGVIIVTSIRALMTHHRAGHVDKDILLGWAPWIALGAAAGGLVAKWAPVELLTIVFAGGALYIAWKRLTGGKKKGASHNLLRRRIKVPVGIGTGFFFQLDGAGRRRGRRHGDDRFRKGHSPGDCNIGRIWGGGRWSRCRWIYVCRAS